MTIQENKDWKQAERHLANIKVELAKIGPAGNPMMVLTVIPLEKRYWADGERTDELYDEIMELH